MIDLKNSKIIELIDNLNAFLRLKSEIYAYSIEDLEKNKKDKKRKLERAIERETEFIKSMDTLKRVDMENLAIFILETFGRKFIEFDLKDARVEQYFKNKYDIEISNIMTKFSNTDLFLEDPSKEFKQASMDWRVFIKNINESIDKIKIEDKGKNYIDSVESIYRMAKEKGLPSINMDKVKMFAIELRIYDKIFKDFNLVFSMVKNKLLEDLIMKEDNKKKKFIRLGIPQSVRVRILERDGNICNMCGAKDYLEVGHKKPISKGGNNSPDNLIILCRRCNQEVGTQIVT